MTDAYGNVQTDSPRTQAVIHPHTQAHTRMQNLMVAAVCELIIVSIMNVTFLPGFRREALKKGSQQNAGHFRDFSGN